MQAGIMTRRGPARVCNNSAIPKSSATESQKEEIEQAKTERDSIWRKELEDLVVGNQKS